MVTNIICVLSILLFIILSVNWKISIIANLNYFKIKVFKITIYKKKTIDLLKTIRIKSLESKPKNDNKYGPNIYKMFISTINISEFIVTLGNNKVSSIDYIVYGLISLYNRLIWNTFPKINYKRVLNRDDFELYLGIKLRIINILYAFEQIRRIKYEGRKTI